MNRWTASSDVVMCAALVSLKFIHFYVDASWIYEGSLHWIGFSALLSCPEKISSQHSTLGDRSALFISYSTVGLHHIACAQPQPTCYWSTQSIVQTKTHHLIIIRFEELKFILNRLFLTSIPLSVNASNVQNN